MASTTLLWQPAIPDAYTKASAKELSERIAERRVGLAGEVVILGHHYQRDDVIEHADFTGDSFKLSQLAAERVEEVGAKTVVFCGVHFMAETADVLTDDDVSVLLPDMGAGCSMADMADYDQTVDAWEQLTELFARRKRKVRLIPICYMNSSAAIKAFCGEHGGAVCTSSNCAKVFAWALAGGDEAIAMEPGEPAEEVKILFIPDQHLGRNTASDAGFRPDRPLHRGAAPADAQMCVWDPRTHEELGGNDENTVLQSTFLLWKGHCSVHKLFRPEHVDDVRAQWPDVTVIAHPECSWEVCQAADLSGSTERIIEAIEGAQEGSRWAIATETHLVERLAAYAARRGVQVRMLSACQCLCTTMVRIDPPHLCWVLDELAQGRAVNRIEVHPEAKKWARKSLDRMLEITANN